MKKFLLIFFLLIFTLPIFAKNTILVLGDSLSSGYGMSAANSWVSLLQKKLDENNYSYKVVNASVSGDTTSNGLTKIENLLSKVQPEIIIIELGGNDGLRGVPIQTIKHNLQKMITLSQQANTKVLLVGLRLPPNFGIDYIQAFQHIYIDLAKSNQIALIENILKGIDEDDSLMQSDRIHPSIQAQRIILENIWPELEKMLKH